MSTATRPKAPKQPEAPAEAAIYIARTQIGSFWQEGDLVGADELAAIPGCDVGRLLAIGALVPAEE